MSSNLREAVLELSSAIYDYKQNSGAKQLERVVLASTELEGYALHLERSLQLAAELSPSDKCACGNGMLVRAQLPGATVPIVRCTDCGAMFATVPLNGPIEAA